MKLASTLSAAAVTHRRHGHQQERSHRKGGVLESNVRRVRQGRGKHLGAPDLGDLEARIKALTSQSRVDEGTASSRLR